MGVFSIITIITLSNAMKYYIQDEFSGMGLNTINIGYKNKDIKREDWLVLSDVELIKKAVTAVEDIGGYMQQTGMVQVESKKKDAVIFGVSSQYRNVSGAELLKGRYVNGFDVMGRKKVIVVTETYAKQNFGNTDVLGKEVQFNASWGGSLRLVIIGVIKEDSDLFGSLFSSDLFPTLVHTPITTLQDFYLNQQKMDSITISSKGSNKDLVNIGKKIVKTLETHKGKKDIYTASNSSSNIQAFSQIIDMISGVLLSVAIVTLLVGGVGIINIMLVSVTERIPEIGIRKALGAKQRDIVLQFLTESILITTVSGLIGIIIGILVGLGISILLKIPPVVDWKTVLISLIGVMLLGLIFGVYPAKKAAELEPVEALRYE
jgi:putative ABC transport system permease protein